VICDGQVEGLSTNYTLLPQVLKTAGYQTHIVGKWDVSCCHMRTCQHVQIGMTTWSMTPTYRGFDTHVGYFGCDEDRLSTTSSLN